MDGNQLNYEELEVQEVMGVNREDSVFPSIYPCYNFMTAAGILQDFNTLISNAGLEHFVADEPDQYAKLTMSVVQNFRFSWTLPIPMVHYNIYNKAVDFPLHDFCAAIKVPYWGSDERIRGQPKHLQDLYSEICQGRGLTAESEDDLDAYLEEHCPRADDDGREPEEDFTQPFDTASSSYQYFDYGASTPSPQDPDYDHARYDPPG